MIMDNKIYNRSFHANREANTRNSAKNILKIVLDVFDVKSVCDVGGGIGVWEKEYMKQRGEREQEVLLLDGDYIDEKDLTISPKYFKKVDLEQRFSMERRFDLALSLEVAEHLTVKRAESFIEDLTKLSDVILFSAAISKQGGAGHINEQPVSYWKSIFEENGYTAFDIIRPNIQNEEDVLSWYKQNTMVYVKKDSPLVDKFARVKCPPVIDYVAIDLYIPKAKELERIHNSIWGKLWAVQWKCMVLGYRALKRIGIISNILK